MIKAWIRCTRLARYVAFLYKWNWFMTWGMSGSVWDIIRHGCLIRTLTSFILSKQKLWLCLHTTFRKIRCSSLSWWYLAELCDVLAQLPLKTLCEWGIGWHWPFVLQLWYSSSDCFVEQIVNSISRPMVFWIFIIRPIKSVIKKTLYFILGFNHFGGVIIHKESLENSTIDPSYKSSEIWDTWNTFLASARFIQVINFFFACDIVMTKFFVFTAWGVRIRKFFWLKVFLLLDRTQVLFTHFFCSFW